MTTWCKQKLITSTPSEQRDLVGSGLCPEGDSNQRNQGILLLPLVASPRQIAHAAIINESPQRLADEVRA